MLHNQYCVQCEPIIKIVFCIIIIWLDFPTNNSIRMRSDAAVGRTSQRHPNNKYLPLDICFCQQQVVLFSWQWLQLVAKMTKEETSGKNCLLLELETNVKNDNMFMLSHSLCGTMSVPLCVSLYNVCMSALQYYIICTYYI